jgi:hypothetical protein
MHYFRTFLLRNRERTLSLPCLGSWHPCVPERPWKSQLACSRGNSCEAGLPAWKDQSKKRLFPRGMGYTTAICSGSWGLRGCAEELQGNRYPADLRVLCRALMCVRGRLGIAR